MYRILLVEDEEAHAELVRRYFDDPAYELAIASDGAQAIEEGRRSRPDLILLDINLGPLSIDGWEVNRRLKADPATAAIPVIALTVTAFLKECRQRATDGKIIRVVDKAEGYWKIGEIVADVLHHRLATSMGVPDV